MLQKLYSWYGKKVVQAVIGVTLLLLAVALYLALTGDKGAEVAPEAQKATVTTNAVRSINFETSFTAVGVVEAVAEAKLQTESGGRVTSVTTEIGKSVKAGAVLATIENAAQSAAVLQAQGAYEAALAGSASGEVGVAGAKLGLESAQKSGVTTFQSAYITLDSVLHSTVDDYFTISNGIATGFKLEGKGQAVAINAERTELETLINAWAAKKSSVSTANVSTELKTARETAKRIATFVEQLSSLAQDQEVSASYSQAEKDVVVANINTARVSANGVVTQLEATQTQINAAEKALEQAQLAGSQGLPSASSAQVKIALGSLRAAQAQYEKTLVRTPISGVVNALYLKTGEYVSPSQPAAVVANNSGLQVSTSVSEEDASALAIGDSVSVNGIKSGTITALGGAIDPATGKVGVKISIDDTTNISNGSTVTIAFTQSAKVADETITVPLSAVKMTGNGPIAFEVVNGVLKAIPLTLGEISGESVVITAGLTLDTVIVIDARGLKEGDVVEVTTN